jgi:DNA (cytosine-5)-methyltransferase 1
LKQTYCFDGDTILRRLTMADSEWRTTVRNIAENDLPADAAWWQSILRGARVEPVAGASELTVVDAFCGSGGLGLGVAMAAEAVHRKARFAAIIDTDHEAVRVHQHNLGARRIIAQSVTGLVDYHVQGSAEAARFGYMPEVISEPLSALRDIDLFVAGPPCQGHSNLNNHTRRQDPRNELYVTTIALGVALGARAFLIENVPTVQNSHSDVVATALALLAGEGYAISTATLRADELGAAQRRSRFFVLAVKGADLRPEFLTECAEALKATARPVSWAIGDLVGREPSTMWDTSPELTQANQKRVDFLFDNGLFDLPDAERPDCHKNGTTYTAVYGRMHWDRPSQTITTGIGTPGQGRYIHPLERRLITPHEAARLQGYPEWFDFAPSGLPLKRKNLAKWIGDAVHPVLGYAAAMAAFQGIELAERRQSRRAA